MTIPEKLKEARKAAGYTQKSFGILCGYSQVSAERTVQRWESGAVYVPIEKLRTVSKLLKLPLEDLIP